MSVGILLVTHQQLGQEIFKTLSSMLPSLPLHVAVHSVHNDCNVDQEKKRLQAVADDTNSGDGLLIATDLFGSTPSNLSHALRADYPVAVITGINLPMLVRIMNYPDLPLAELSEKAQQAAHDGVKVELLP